MHADDIRDRLADNDKQGLETIMIVDGSEICFKPDGIGIGIQTPVPHEEREIRKAHAMAAKTMGKPTEEPDESFADSLVIYATFEINGRQYESKWIAIDPNRVSVLVTGESVPSLT